MAAKVPVLVSDMYGPMEIIENGKYGLHFGAGNSEKLAEQIQYIITNYSTDEFKRIIEVAYLHVKGNFDISTTALNHIKKYYYKT